MKHPTRETWLTYLYGEAAGRTERRRLQRHLAECTECQAQLAAWGSVRGQLDSWSLPPRRVTSFPRRSWVPLAAAAAFLLAIGAALGRYTTPSNPDLDALREAMRPEMQKLAADTQSTLQSADRENTQALLAEYARLQDERRQEDLAALARALQTLENQHASDYTSLRRDLETVAVLTDASFRSARNRMVRLASLPVEFSQPNTDSIQEIP